MQTADPKGGSKGARKRRIQTAVRRRRLSLESHVGARCNADRGAKVPYQVRLVRVAKLPGDCSHFRRIAHLEPLGRCAKAIATNHPCRADTEIADEEAV